MKLDKKKKKLEPPHWANRFLEWYCDDELVDEIQGDLFEAFYHRQVQVGKSRAKWWFIWDVLRFCRLSSFNKSPRNSINTNMYRNYLVTSFRNFKRDKAYASINMAGLIIGLSSCLLIALHVKGELDYDHFHPNAEDIYRVPMDMYNRGALTTKSATVFAGVGPGLLNDFPEIEDYVTISPFASGVFSVNKDTGSPMVFNQDRVVYATDNFFEFFGFELLSGSEESLLDEPFSAVVSRSVAIQYFGTTDVIGKTLKRQGQEEFKVMGVMENMPVYSHINYDIILSIDSFDDLGEALEDWSWSDFYAYVRLKRNVNVLSVNAKVKSYLDNVKSATFEKYNVRQELWLQPVKDIHLYSDLTWEMSPNGSAENVYFLVAIASFILVIAWVNYINLSTARASKRAKEVGVRKVLGSSRNQLRHQFIVEAFLYNLVAIILSLGMVVSMIPFLNATLDLTLSPRELLSNSIGSALLLLLFLGTLATGVYPAFVLSKFKPIHTLKGAHTRSNATFRQSLVVFQFIVSITLVVGTLVMSKQLKFMQNQLLGIDVSKVLVVNGATAGENFDDLLNRAKIIQSELKALPFVESFSTSSMVPGQENFNLSGYTSSHVTTPQSSYNLTVSADYFNALDIEFLVGRSFDLNLKTDGKTVVLNESAIKLLGFLSPEEAIGEIINRGKRNERQIIGVVKDFHQRSLKEQIDPIVFYFDDVGDEGSYYFLKMTTADLATSMDLIEDTWASVFPDNPLDFYFLDEFFNRQYQSDQLFNRVFVAFTILAIFVASLGLFGLISFTAEQSKKQIAIRKILGASVKDIVVMLTQGYVGLISIAILIGFPLSFYATRQWLQGFAYQTSLGIEMFILGGLIIVIIVFRTVSFKSIKVANDNPVNSLREE